MAKRLVQGIRLAEDPGAHELEEESCGETWGAASWEDSSDSGTS